MSEDTKPTLLRRLWLRLLATLGVAAAVLLGWWWRVEDADTTVWILAMPEGRLPPGVTWDRSVLDRRLKGANRLLQGDRVSLTAKLGDAPATQSPQLDILAPGQEDPEPAMKGARISLEAEMRRLAQEFLDNEAAAQDSTTREPSGKA